MNTFSRDTDDLCVDDMKPCHNLSFSTFDSLAVLVFMRHVAFPGSLLLVDSNFCPVVCCLSLLLLLAAVAFTFITSAAVMLWNSQRLRTQQQHLSSTEVLSSVLLILLASDKHMQERVLSLKVKKFNHNVLLYCYIHVGLDNYHHYILHNYEPFTY